MSDEPVAVGAAVGVGAAARAALLRLAPIVLVGAVLGVLVGGVGGRLAMLLLARLNPEATGLTSDDGFVMGQFTVRATLGLLFVGLVLGVVGGVVYFVVRGLRFGPGWFQVVSVALGAGVVVAAQIVHPDGVDFVLLHPVGLAIALFVAIPFLYGAVLTVVAERLLVAGSWWRRLPGWAQYLPLLLLVVAPFVIPVLALGWVLGYLVRTSRAGAEAMQRPQPRWFGRLVLAAYFALSVNELVADAIDLV